MVIKDLSRRKTRWQGWLVLVLGLLMAIRTGNTVVRLWKAGSRVDGSKLELLKAEEENLKLKSRLSEVQSPNFVEKEAREKLGYGRPGEVIVLLPKEESDQSQKKTNSEDTPIWKRWWDLYVGI